MHNGRSIDDVLPCEVFVNYCYSCLARQYVWSSRIYLMVSSELPNISCSSSPLVCTSLFVPRGVWAAQPKHIHARPRTPLAIPYRLSSGDDEQNTINYSMNFKAAERTSVLLLCTVHELLNFLKRTSIRSNQNQNENLSNKYKAASSLRQFQFNTLKI